MKKRIHILAFLIISINIFSQQVDTIKPVNSLQKGSWSVQFEVGSDFKLQSFEGVLVSLKYHLSDRFALRFGAGYNGEKNNSQVDYFNEYTNEKFENDEIEYSDNIFITMNCLYYFRYKSKLNVYAGIGPRAGYIASYDEDASGENQLNISDINSWSVGINGVIGCEWFPLDYLSFMGEYSFYGTYGKTVSKFLNYNEITHYSHYFSKRYSDDYEFKGNTVKLGISLYF